MTRSNKAVAEEWSVGNEAKGSHFFTDGITIWSYGYHFPIATKLKSGEILFNTDGYSVSTSRHKNIVLRECGGFGRVIDVDTKTLKYVIDRGSNILAYSDLLIELGV